MKKIDNRFPYTEKLKLQETLRDRFGMTESGLWWRLLSREDMHKSLYKELEQFPEIRRNTGFGNGYIGVPKGHPFYGKDYNALHELYQIDIHGGLTYSEQEGDYWVIGFDTAHASDTSTTCNEKYCLNQLMYLLKQVEDAWNPS
jgi:hypothetical protein